MARHDASELASRLGRHAEAVCKQYLSSGHRAGRYWIVGDTKNTPGRSMFVRLAGPASGKGAAGKWTDAATGEHGDLFTRFALALQRRKGDRSLGHFAHRLLPGVGEVLIVPEPMPVVPRGR